jgi:ribosome maturation factor RimP
LQWTPRNKDDSGEELRLGLETLLKGLGMVLVEFSISRHKGGTPRVALTVARQDGADVGHQDCAAVHHAVTPRLDLFFGEQDFSVEVASPGLGRV